MSQLKRNNQSLFAAETATNIRLIFFVLISIALMTVDHRQQHLDALRDALATLIYPLQYIIQLPFEGGGSLSGYLAERSTLLEENARLRQKQLLINAQLQKLTALEVENRRLRMLLESSANIQERVLIAELLTVDFDPYRHQILLNKGTRDGVHAGQPLLDEQGIIGQIIHVHTFTSMGILITDPNHAVPVQVNRNGLRTLAVGTGNFRELELPYIPNNGDIQVGDLLISSGLGGRFPRGYPVARVTRVDVDPGRPFAQVVARPTAQLDRSREVLLIITNPPATSFRSGETEEEPSSPDEAPGQTGEDQDLDPSGSGETPSAPPGAAARP